MTVDRLEVLVEERSVEDFLTVLIPKLLPDVSVGFHNFQSKRSLLHKLESRLAAYKYWLPKNHHILVLVDRDSDDCKELKRQLEDTATRCGFVTRSSRSAGEPYQVTNRILVEELEAWFFGDWEAVQAAYPKLPANIPNRRRFRDSDNIKGGTWDAFERVLQEAGYFKTGLRKIEVARAVSVNMDPWRNRSNSFRVFRDALLDLAGG